MTTEKMTPGRYWMEWVPSTMRTTREIMDLCGSQRQGNMTQYTWCRRRGCRDNRVKELVHMAVYFVVESLCDYDDDDNDAACIQTQ
jgi:hypothetical protein